MTYKVDWKYLDVLSAAQINENFLTLRDNLEVYEDCTTQIDGLPTIVGGTTKVFTVSNPMTVPTLSLIEVFRNGKLQRLFNPATSVGDYQFPGPDNQFEILSVPAIGETVAIRYRKAVS